MKKIRKIGILLFLLWVLASAAACRKGGPSALLYDRIPMVMVEDEIYTDTGEAAPAEVDGSNIAGKITSSVDASEIPKRDGESNFGCVGAEYVFYKGGLAVEIDGGWYLFQKYEEGS